MAMNARLPMMTTCCNRKEQRKQQEGVEVGSGQVSCGDGAIPRESKYSSRERLFTYGCDLDTGRVVCVKAHHAVLQPAASLSCGASCAHST